MEKQEQKEGLPIIWDCVDDDLKLKHPPLHLALQRVKQKIENCLCKSYNIVDPPDDDHKEALLSLKGTFRVETSSKEPFAYGFMDKHGIAINAELVAASDALWGVYETADAFMDNIDGLSYVSILEETIEHELAHLKNHQRLMNTFSQDTKNESPLKGESGYAVQHSIRQRFGKEGDQRRIIQASDACHRRQFKPPVHARWVEVVKQREFSVKNVYPSKVLTLEDLKSHMSYPPIDDDECNNATLAESKMSSREKRKRRRDNDDKERDKSGGGPSNLGPSSNQKSHQGDSGSKHGTAGGSSAGSTKTATMEGQSCTDSNGHDAHVEIGDTRDYIAACNSMEHCTVDIQLCDESRNPKQKFFPEENIYILATFRNPTENDVYAQVYGGGHNNIDLGRGGARFSIRDGPDSYTPTPVPGKLRMVKIGPGNHYTFFRNFCVSRSSDYTFYGSWTPEEAGQYTAVVSCLLDHGVLQELGNKEFEIVQES